MTESDDNKDSGATPRSRREQLREVVDAYKERLRDIKGQVFHMIDSQNQLFQLRIGSEGQISLSHQIMAIPSSINLASIASVPKKVLEAGIEAPKRVLEAGIEARDKMKNKATRRWRKAVTGDPEKRIRDHMKEVPQVKMIDKLSFTFGVLCICGSEWISLRHADWFPVYYSIIMTLLLLWRLVTYTQDKYQLFMLDFCYFVNLSVFLQTTFFMENILWFKANYVLCMGPLMFAIIIWKNSLVFHSLDKLTSFFLHAFPPIVVHLLRWGLIPSPYHYPDTSLSITQLFTYPLLLYLAWQIGYLFITDVLLRRALREDKDLITSLRWLVKDKKNGFRNLCIKLLIKLGVAEPGEDLDPDSVKAKTVFSSLQLLYTLITILPTPLLYTSYRASCAYLVFIFGWGTWNGASYYIEVFAERYRLQFITIADSDKDDDGSVATINSDDDDNEDDSDLFEMASEDIEIDEASELYQTIAEGIIKSVSITEEDMSNLKGIEPLNKSCQKETKEEADWEEIRSEEKKNN